MNEMSSLVVKTGIEGLDDIVRGGLPRDCLYLVSGTPGAGKTTLAMQFLLEGVARGEKSLYITLSETASEIDQVARSHGWQMEGVQIVELVASEQNLAADALLTIFNPSELELGETTQAMLAAVEKHRPQRLVLDSLSELRLIAQNSLRYRRQVLALKQYFAGNKCTVLMLDDRTGGVEDDHLQSIAHGVVQLEQLVNEFGTERRRVRVSKLRGVSTRGGYHDLVIKRGGIEVFPRLVAAEHHTDFVEEDLQTGNAALDTLLGGGLPAGTSTLLLGPAGTGKSTVATQFAVAATARGDRVAMFLFDEAIGTFTSRARKLNILVDDAVDKSLLTLQRVNAAELSAGEFTTLVRNAAEGRDGRPPARMVVIDSLNGYLNAMPEEKFLTAQLHELLAYLGQRGTATVLSVTQSGIAGNMTSPVDTTYLADNVILFRYFEAMGHVRRAISVVKKRNGNHERSIRELDMNSNGIVVGERLEEFHGVLTGVPIFVGGKHALMGRN